jgi:tellurite resistance protein/uncharacterized membrane protein YhdT
MLPWRQGDDDGGSDMDNPYQDYSCPYCRQRSIETVATAHYVRGFVLAYQIGWKKFPACVGCARAQLLKEAGLSALIGWFSITCIFLNPLFIGFLILKTPFVGKNTEAIDKLFQESGIPRPGQGVDVLKTLYGLAAKMIAADGKIDQREVTVAAEQGQRLTQDFVYGGLQEAVDNHKSLPETRTYAEILGQALSNDHKIFVLRYLYMIAMADGELERREERLLREMKDLMGVENFNIEELLSAGSATPAQTARAESAAQA